MILNINLPARHLVALAALFAALAGFTLLYSLWQWHSDWVIAHQTLTGAPSFSTVDESTRLVAAIPNDHLFGQSLQGDMPISNLQLQVTGIVKVTNEDHGVSKAYISIAGQPSKIYQTGDKLPYGVKVYDIAPDAVILQNNGRLEKLPLPREKLEFKPRDTKESMW